MSLFGKQEKSVIESLEKEIENLKKSIPPESVTLAELQMKISRAEEECRRLDLAIKERESKLSCLESQIIETDEIVLLQSFGMYTPHYAYTTSDEYKETLKQIRSRQKEMIKCGEAVSGDQNWHVNGSLEKGKKMVKDTQKLLLRAFNAECDDAVEHVKFNNIEASEKKILASADAISKLGEMMRISIVPFFVKLKISELRLMHEYQVKRQEEKEAAKEARQRQREEAKAQKELEEAKRKLEKEQVHYENALSHVLAQMESADEAELKDLEEKKEQLEKNLLNIKSDIEQVDYRAANQRAGYVYIISNIGAFGENVYKIGMTRRLDPMERIDELGDASVPFNFDVHAMIFSDDAPGLETALHTAFADKKVNFINQRREFFNVTLDEIKEVVRKNYDKTVEFVDLAPAEQYRESLKLRNEKTNALLTKDDFSK